MDADGGVHQPIRPPGARANRGRCHQQGQRATQGVRGEEVSRRRCAEAPQKTRRMHAASLQDAAEISNTPQLATQFKPRQIAGQRLLARAVMYLRRRQRCRQLRAPCLLARQIVGEPVLASCLGDVPDRPARAPGEGPDRDLDPAAASHRVALDLGAERAIGRRRGNKRGKRGLARPQAAA